MNLDTFTSVVTKNMSWKKLLLAGTVFGGAACFLGNYFHNVVEKPQLYFQEEGDNEIIHAVVDSAKSLKEFYYPPPWCYSGHLNTIVSSIVRFLPSTPCRR